MSAAVEVSLLQFLPMMPPVGTGPQGDCIVRVEGGMLQDPVWLPEYGQLRLIDRTRRSQLIWSVDGSITSGVGPAGVSMAAIGPSELVVCTESRLSSLDLATDTWTALDYGESVGLPPPRLLAPGGGRQLICVFDEPDGSCNVVCLGDGAPQQLLYDSKQITAICVEECTLLLSSGTSVYRAFLSQDMTKCSRLVELLSTSPSQAGQIATDIQNQIYVCTDDGVKVFDSDGNALLMMHTPSPATGCCFGGAGLTMLFVTTHEQVWRVKTNVQGAPPPPSEEFLHKIDILARANGDGRHMGW